MKTLRLALLFCALGLFVLSCSDDDTVAPPPDDPGPDPVGTIRTWAGTGHAGYNGEGVDRLSANFYWPNDIEFTPSIGTYVVDWNNHRIRRIDPDGKLITVVGTASTGDGPASPNAGGDIPAPGIPGTDCDLNHPTQVFQRANGKLAVVCWHNHKIRELDTATGLIQVLIGRGNGCTGEGQNIALNPATLLNQASRAVEAPDGSLYINDQRNQCIRKIDPAGVFTTVVAAPPVCNNAPGAFAGDNGPPLLAKINMPTGGNPKPAGALELDAEGRLYIADTANHRIRRVDFVANVITTVVGNGTAAFAGDGGDPLNASLNAPIDIEFGPDGRLYIADTFNNAVRAVDFTANTITTVVGTGVSGFSGDGGPATSARLRWPFGVAFDADGHLYVADTYNQRIRRVKMHE